MGLQRIYRRAFRKRRLKRTFWDKWAVYTEKSSYTLEQNLLHFQYNNYNLRIRGVGHSDLEVFGQIFRKKEYQLIADILTLNACEKPLVVIDAGANIGFTSVFLHQLLPACRFIAIEPDLENARLAKANLEANEVDFVFLQKALAEAPGKRFDLGRQFRDAKDWAFTTEANAQGSIPGITIPEIIDEQNLDYISFLKIDIEGYERFIFSEQANLDFLDKVAVLALEIHDEFDCRETIYQRLRAAHFLLFNHGELTVGIKKNFGFS